MGEIRNFPDVGRGARPLVAAPMLEDPLEADEVGDATITTTRRALIRVALIAAETAGRFASDGVGLDPMAWMLAGRRMFHGASAVEACLSRTDCMRALLLHGLGLGLDADPDDLDELALETEAEADGRTDPGRDGAEDSARPPVAQEGAPRLFTSTVVEREADGWVHLFHAAVAESREAARAKLMRSQGHRVAAAAETVEGFRSHLPLADVLLSPALADMLEQVGRDPASPLAAGLDICVAQRFAA